MARSSKNFYLLLLLVITIILSGCELNRDNNNQQLANPESLGAMPTLAPLGATNSEPVATAIPTVINIDEPVVDAPAAGEQIQVVDTNPDGATAPVDLSTEPIVSNGVQEAAVVPETFVPEAKITEPLIVDAPTSAELPTGGPIAVNPPASKTSGNYATTPAYGGTTYTVQSGDTLFGISSRYGTSVDALMVSNSLSSETIYYGQVLTIPSSDGGYIPPDSTNGYVVVAGETLFSIAQTYGTSVEAIADINNIPAPYTIYTDQQLIIPNSYSASPPAGGVPIPSGSQVTHTIANGETLSSIAQLYGTTVETLIAINNLTTPNQISAGQLIFLP